MMCCQKIFFRWVGDREQEWVGGGEGVGICMCLFVEGGAEGEGICMCLFVEGGGGG